MFYILTKRASTMKHIKKVLYVTIQTKKSSNSVIKYFTEEKYQVRDANKCPTFLTFIEFTLVKSDSDVRYTSYLMENFFLNSECKQNSSIRNEAIRICKLFLENQYIDKILKDKINSFLNEVNGNNNEVNGNN